ncbi:MAG: indolepyruvate ferredoxin oxidoreductase subunit alpha [Mogibacterium sp.]|nr:indolepyruvate ferredoxin oxidoreductase subunit alpha [Mogibacterium sp.]
MKVIMSGNEAIARGAYEGGARFASAYPGTPSTEILENMPQYGEKVYSEWAPNEKVAAEAAIGASISGVRSFCAMKHVGMNVAADPIYTFAYTGVTGGFVMVVADDPGQHSSQNEQDNRNQAKGAKLLMLEPSDSQEAKDYMKKAFALSEEMDMPILMHVTTRICHSKGIVELGEREEADVPDYKPMITKYVTAPANAKVLRATLEDRLAKAKAYSNNCEFNKAEMFSTKIGVVTSGVSYQYARETFGEDASYLKLGLTNPLPDDLIKDFCSKVDKVYVVEEMDPYLEEHLKMLGIDCLGKDVVPKFDELNTDLVRKAFLGVEPETYTSDMKTVVRPPALCAGCPHRGLFYGLMQYGRKNKIDLMITGDIGCYTLGSAAPLNAIHTCICMGASLSQGHGASIALKNAGKKTKVCSVIGDSTFFHTGVNSLMDAAYNGGHNLSIILDNRITGMTGHQQNPGSGYTLMGKEAPEVDIPALCKSIGIKEENIITVNPNHLDEVKAALDVLIPKDEPTVLITRWPCVLKKFSQQDLDEFPTLHKTQCVIDQDKCINCKICVKTTGCPGLISTKDKVVIDYTSCNGCTVCKQVCPKDAIEEVTR